MVRQTVWSMEICLCATKEICTTCTQGHGTPCVRQKGNHDGLLNSLIMGMSLCGTTGKSTPLKMGCNCGETAVFCTHNQGHVVAHNGRVNNSVERESVLLVHTGQGAEHLGLPNTQGNTSRGVKASKTSLAHATANKTCNSPSGPKRP